MLLQAVLPRTTNGKRQKLRVFTHFDLVTEAVMQSAVHSMFLRKRARRNRRTDQQIRIQSDC